MFLPEPVLSYDDIMVTKERKSNPSSLISTTWSKDPTKLAILRALGSCYTKLDNGRGYFTVSMVDALTQGSTVCFLHSCSMEVEEVHH